MSSESDREEKNPGTGKEWLCEESSRQLKEIMRSCYLCPRHCGVDRQNGERGFCDLTDRMIVSCALPHHGEEPPLSGTGGAGTIFFSSCNLRCCYCQNYQISHSRAGRSVGEEDLVRMMVDLDREGCHVIEFVTGTAHLAGIVPAIGRAVKAGLSLPLVYNSGGYENPAVIELLEGIIDVYLPDFKYGDSETARRFNAPPDYGERALESLKKMVAQVGDELVLEEGIARRGIILRHLILPGMVDNSRKILGMVKRHISTSIPLSLMAQYTPVPQVTDDPFLGRRVTKEEYGIVVDEALDLGFEYLFIQEVDEANKLPDFDKPHPFRWD